MSNVTIFHGTVIFGMNNDKNNPDVVAVYDKGMVLNDPITKHHPWPNSSTQSWKGAATVRHYFVSPMLNKRIMRKSAAAKMLGISNLNSTQRGHKVYRDTPIGDVLYITCDTNLENWEEAQRIGFFDKHCQIHI